VPKAVPDVPAEFLRARDAWSDKAAYDKAAADLATRFAKNFEKFDVPAGLKAAGPGKK
jgi:phosphoenolpyruvate carboxykinase (ATP)